MTFGPRHYVPVLKVKRGEKKALQNIAATLQPQIIPLLEIVERRAENSATITKHLNTAFKDLAQSVRGYPKCFLDAREIAPDGATAAAEVFQRASNEGILFTPVTGLSRNADLIAALQHSSQGIALRLTREEFEHGALTTAIEAFLAQHTLQPEQIDLIIDLGAVEDLIVDGVATLTKGFLADIPNHQRWRTFTLSACAFPKSMGGVDRNSHDFHTREEWIAWRDHLHAIRQSFVRLPTFSDCAIQHPLGVEGFDPKTMQVSASIRYTLSDAWLLIKGQSTRFVRPGTQFPDLATRLVYGHLRGHFLGAIHCEGCNSMKAAADGAFGIGSAEAWRRLGTIHHISMVMDGLGSLPWP
jgi:hypothetical protein